MEDNIERVVVKGVSLKMTGIGVITKGTVFVHPIPDFIKKEIEVNPDRFDITYFDSPVVAVEPEEKPETPVLIVESKKDKDSEIKNKPVLRRPVKRIP